MLLIDRLFTADGGENLRRLAGAGVVDARVERSLQLAARQRLTVDEYWRLLAERAAFVGDELRRLDQLQVDCIVCPVDASVAFGHGESPTHGAGQAYAAMFNILGLPAGVVTIVPGSAPPCPSDRQRAADSSSDGLPVAVQVVARRYQEPLLLRVMSVLEEEALGGHGLPLAGCRR
jgi:fatty acid amide hydrolase